MPRTTNQSQSKKAPSKRTNAQSNDIPAIDAGKPHRICPQCTEPFTPRRANQYFCTHACKLAYHKPNHACPECGAIHRIRRPDSPGLQYEKQHEKAPN